MPRGVYERPKMTAETPTDEELGIGIDDDAAAQDSLAALMADPKFATLIDAAVAARLGQIGAPAPQASSQAFDNLAKTLGHMIEVNAMQQPGYIKPLSADEVDRRAAGYVEMRALLEEYEAKGTPPHWTVGEGGFFECANAQEFVEGQPVATYLPPPEDFVPQNKEARKVHAAMLQWIGGPSPEIGERVREAEAARNRGGIPLVTGSLQPDRKPGLVEVLETAIPAKAKASTRRAMGSLVPERRDVSMAERAAGPQGPVFNGA